MTRNILTIVFFILGVSGMAQVPIKKDRGLLEERKTILSRIHSEANRSVLSSAERQRLSEQYGFPLSIALDHQRTAAFQYMDEAGQPVYYTTFNVSAALTT